MCRASFDMVGRVLEDMVDIHGGVLVASREEIIEFLREELGDVVDDQTIIHYALALGRHDMGTAPHALFTDGAVVVLRDTDKYPYPWDAPTKGAAHIAPDAKRLIHEQMLELATA